MSLSGLTQATVSQEASQGEVMNPGGTQTAEEATDGAKESVKDATKEGAKKKAKDNGPKVRTLYLFKVPLSNSAYTFIWLLAKFACYLPEIIFILMLFGRL
jgi:hypothetical protein